MDVTVRPGQLADIFRMQQIEDSAGELFRGSGLIDVDSMAAVGITDHTASIEEGLSFVAEIDGRTAGFAMGEMHDRDAYLRELDVDLAYQKRGIGAELVKTFCAAAKAKDAQNVYLSTFRSPPWNAPFYRRLGFEDVAQAAFLPWMTAIWQEQAVFLDMNTRVFMKRRL